MKTDELIKVLSTNIEPTDPRRIGREVSLAIVIGSAVSIVAALIHHGIRADLTNIHALTFLVLKLAFALGIVVSAAVYLVKLCRPGGEMKAQLAWTAWPFVGVVVLAAMSLVSVPLWHWRNMAMDDEWLECLVSIPVIAVVPFAVVIWVVRRMAPTDLTRTGAVAGLIAGGMSAAGYALHCTADSLPFIALWYGVTIALCGLAGAALGPRLLRW